MSDIFPLVLLVIDGWGVAPNSKGNAIELEGATNMKSLAEKYSSGLLEASGEAVGMPYDEDGNSEVGHLNLGAGRIVLQSLPKINMSIVDGSFFENEALLGAVAHAKKFNSDLHLLGLIGSGGVHAYNDHLLALVQLAKKNGVKNLYIHLITDGRDSSPTEAKVQISRLMQELKTVELGQIVTIMGRYYAMDRDLRWERTEAAYDALTDSVENTSDDVMEVLETNYQNQLTDEFIKPTPIGPNSLQTRVKDNDALVFFNFRIDRPRQLAKALVLPDFEEGAWEVKGFDPYETKYHQKHIRPQVVNKPFKRKKVIKNLFMVTMVEYEPGLPVSVAFKPEIFEKTLGAVVAEAGLKQLRLAETEKERFVTFYFSGRHDGEFPNEDRLMVESPRIATYDLKPEMATAEIVSMAVDNLRKNKYDFYVINIAAPDMVAHTGNLEATKKAVRAADDGVGILAREVLRLNGTLVVTADHGNAEELLNGEDQQVDTEHSTNPVPLIIVNDKLKDIPHELPKGVLADVAPTILKIMNMKVPEEMTGRPLF